MNRYTEEDAAFYQGEAEADAQAEADDKAKEAQGQAEAAEWNALTPEERAKEELARINRDRPEMPDDCPF